MNETNFLAKKHAIVLFDGVCNFCDASVNFIFAHDARGYFQFAALQSEAGQYLQEKFNLKNVDSVILIENDRAFVHSDAALRIARKLNGGWSWSYVLTIIPRFARDWVYKFFARHRYQLFGKKDVCAVPKPELRQRFLT